MENEQMNQQPTYEQIVQAYNALANENQQLRFELNNLRNDKTLERMNSLVELIAKFNSSSDKGLSKAVKNAIWHLNQILSKPKK